MTLGQTNLPSAWPCAAAQYLGVGETKFDAMVADGGCQAGRIDGSTSGVRALDHAFDVLDGDPTATIPSDVVAKVINPRSEISNNNGFDSTCVQQQREL